MRYARPWRPVNPLLTIWETNAISEAQVEHLKISAPVRRSRRTGGSSAHCLSPEMGTESRRPGSRARRAKVESVPVGGEELGVVFGDQPADS
jgi:hypothetical protein